MERLRDSGESDPALLAAFARDDRERVAGGCLTAEAVEYMAFAQ